MTSNTSLKLAAISMTTSADKVRNIDEAERLVREAAKLGADWVQLPEMFPFMGDYAYNYEMAELEGGPLYQRLSELAKELKVVLFAGTVGERPKPDEPLDFATKNAIGQKKVFNTSYVFGRDGELLAKYRKIHLFNLNGEDGRPRYAESDGFIPGEEPVRAVEHQSDEFAANQTGVHSPGKESFGHALIIDPWGDVLADSGDQPGVALATLSGATLKDVRSRLPALANRRPEVYRGN